MKHNTMSLQRRIWNGVIPALIWAAAGLAAMLAIGILAIILFRGLPRISWSLLTGVPSVIRKIDGILPYILNTLYIIFLALLIVLPLGVGAAIYLSEYAANKKLISVIEFTTETLAGIPSIIYGLVGMLVFVNALKLQSSLLSGSLTLVVMTLPVIMRTTQESLKTVPQSYREGAAGLGATKWYAVRTIILPSSIDGIVTGSILAVGRIVGESAALLFTAGCGSALLTNVLQAYSRSGATLSVALYMYAFENGDFEVAWAIAAVLLILVLCINLLARWTCRKLGRKEM